ncbi:MAG: response regulator [Phycisphaeraceae bacterium]|nr:response regulator [Phycisphaeraceae bacterium]
MRIMIVDDSKTMRSIQKNVLKRLGYAEIAEACDGRDALSQVGAFDPHLILLDRNMPEMDGLAFLKSYRGRGHKALVIMVTTEAEKPKVIEALKAGLNNYLIKPFTPEGLSMRIKETLERSAAA